MRSGRVARSLAKGLVAGAFGTAAMTVSSTIEMKVRRRPASSAPADAAEKVLGIRTEREQDRQRLSNLVHWSYGTGWGAARGVIGLAGLSGPVAAAAHLAAVWGSELFMLPRLGVVPPIREWGSKEIAIDALHHLVYAGATGAVYELLDRKPVRIAHLASVTT